MTAAPQLEPVADEPPPPKPVPPEPYSEPELPPVEDPVEEGAPAWTLTFGDMMSLLLTFFILLFSMSTIEVEKFRAAAGSLREGFSSTLGELSMPPPPPSDSTVTDTERTEKTELTDAELDAIADRLEEFVKQNRLEQTVIVARESHGVSLRIQDVALFPPGAASIEEGSEWVIEQLGEVTRLIEAPVVVSGHTDNVPVGGGWFRSNWELSAARAAGVARALVEMGQKPERITVEAFGEYRPIDTNETAEGRATNRRVELYYSRQNVREAMNLPPEEPETTPQTGGAPPQEG